MCGSTLLSSSAASWSRRAMRFCLCELGSTARGSPAAGSRFTGESTAMATWSENTEHSNYLWNLQHKTFWAFGSLYYCVFNCYRERLLPLVLTSLSGLRCNAMPSSWSVLGAVVRHDSGSAAGIIPDEKNSCCNSLSTDGRRAGFDWSCNTIIEAAGLRSDDGILSTLHWD